MVSKLTSLDEDERLKTLLSYDILDSAADINYEQLTELASMACDTGMAWISVFDDEHEWFIACRGINIKAITIEQAFCRYNHQEPFFEVNNCPQDPRFTEHPLVTGETKVIFYASTPLISPKGYIIGALSIADNKTKVVTASQKKQLLIIAKQVVAQLELKKMTTSRNALIQQSINLTQALAARSKEFQQFVFTVSHDLRSPLVTINGFTTNLLTELKEQLTEKQNHRLNRINENAKQMGNLLQDLLKLSRVMHHEVDKEILETQTVIQHLWDNMPSQHQGKAIEFSIKAPLANIYANLTLFSQCINNLLINAIRFKKPSNTLSLTLFTQEQDNYVSLFAQDNGIGIEPRDHQRIFNVFEQVESGEGTGVGLRIVQAAMEKQHGSVHLVSQLGVGSCFELRFPKPI